jgi:putative drug exporter of the RND superfamily
MFGLGLASAVFLDAFVVRSLLLPAVLTLSGERTWQLPPALERRLPRIALEAPSQRRPGHDGAPHVGGLAEEPA